jgi:hypothetical protein
MAEKLGITESEVNDLLKELRDKEGGPNETFTQAAEFYEAVRKVNNEKGTLESTIVVDFEPKDDLELAKLHKINLDKYIITNYWSKLLPNGKFTSSVFSKIKTPADYTAEDFAKFLENYTSNYIPIPRPETRDKRSVDIELSLSDFHLAKRTISDNETLQDRYNRFLSVATDLVEQADMMYDIDTIVFPISNDYFHTDNYQNQTTNGTPQDVIADYASEYEMGFTILVDTIKMLLSKAKQVAVVLVQGNHDRTKSYYLAHALDVFFKSEKRVGFLRDHSVVKGIMLGETFIGYHHGNCKIDELPLLFATSPEYSIAFGCATYREVHTGDKHHYMTKEVKGVRIQQVPSLSGTDRWHADNNYVHSVRAALALVYDKKKGKFNEIEERI